MDVEYSTFTVIALPGILFTLSALQRGIGELATRCFGGEVHRCFIAGAIVIFCGNAGHMIGHMIQTLKCHVLALL